MFSFFEVPETAGELVLSFFLKFEAAAILLVDQDEFYKDPK